MKPFKWKSALLSNGEALPAPEASAAAKLSDVATALIEKIKATNPQDWLFERDHCHYAPGGRRNYSRTGLTFVYKPQSLYLGPQDDMCHYSFAELPGGARDLAAVYAAIRCVQDARKRADEEARIAHEKAEAERATRNGQRLLDQFTPEEPPEYLSPSNRLGRMALAGGVPRRNSFVGGL